MDAPEFDELLAAVEELDVPIYLHRSGDPVQHARLLAEAPISPADRDKIAYRNAQHLFRL